MIPDVSTESYFLGINTGFSSYVPGIAVGSIPSGVGGGGSSTQIDTAAEP